MTGGELAGLRVLILRAARAGDPLAERLAAAGAEVQCLPLLRIEPVAVDSARLTGPAAAADAIWIFVSRHAVRHGATVLQMLGLQVQSRELYAVGAATAAAVRDAWGCAARYPEQPNSEGLLQLPGLQRVVGRPVVIFRGVGGRDLLRAELATRGARVSYCEVYRRIAEPRWAARVRAELARPGPPLAIAHSGAVVTALAELLGGAPVRWPVPILVPGSRVASVARTAGFDPLMADSALAAEMEQAVRRWYTPAR